MSRKELVLVPVLEGLLVAIVAVAGWASHQPLIFASLGPTAYEMIETPKRPSARPYNIIGGHLIGILSAFVALMLTHAWAVPSVSAKGVPLLRVAVAVVAVVLTVFGTLLTKARQPAAIATTLLVSLGPMQTWKDAGDIMIAVVIMVTIGEPVRLWRAKALPGSEGM